MGASTPLWEPVQQVSLSLTIPDIAVFLYLEQQLEHFQFVINALKDLLWFKPILQIAFHTDKE